MPQIAVVHAGEEKFGIDIHQVVEILNIQRVHILPQLPQFIAGIVNIRGEVIPLLDIRKRFGISAHRKKERIMVIRSGREKVGLLVDGVDEIIDLNPDEIIKPPSLFKGLKTEYMTGIGKRGDSLIILLNLDTILTSEEKIQIEEISKAIGFEGAGESHAHR